MELLLIVVYFAFIGLLIYFIALVIRWAFKIDRQLQNQQATVWLLMKLCEKHGIDTDEIKTIMNQGNTK